MGKRRSEFDPANPLSKREEEVVELLVRECLHSVAAARRMMLSRKTVETHRANIHRKLGCHSMAELCRWFWGRERGEVKSDLA